MKVVSRKRTMGVLWPRIKCVSPFLALCYLLNASSGVLGGPPQINGLMEPYRTIDVAATESGVIAHLHVREGQAVTKNERLATLDSNVLSAMLAIARQDMETKGRLDAARAELQLKQQRAKNFAAVLADGHARPEEVQRAQTDLAIARAHLRAAREDLVLKRLEYEKINAQIERRSVLAPLDGIVSQIHKEEGEFVAPNEPSVLTIVQLDPLLAVFSLTTQQVSHLHPGQEVSIQLSDCNRSTTATVESISPVADAESGTVLVKMRIDNSEGAYRSGTRCTLELPGDDESRASAPDASLSTRTANRDNTP